MQLTTNKSSLETKSASRSRSKIGTAREEAHKDQAGLKELRGFLHNSKLRQHTFVPSSSEEFTYHISILNLENDTAETVKTLAMATLDTGCHDNWISVSVIKRAKLDKKIVPVEETEIFESFSGHTMRPQGKVQVTFVLEMANGTPQQSRMETFNVFEALPVDLVLGKGFIAQQFTLISKFALGLVKQGRFTPGNKAVLSFFPLSHSGGLDSS